MNKDFWKWVNEDAGPICEFCSKPVCLIDSSPGFFKGMPALKSNGLVVFKDDKRCVCCYDCFDKKKYV